MGIGSRQMKWMAGLGLALSLAIAPVQAANRVALVIGNAAYKGGLALPNPVNDALLMEKTLQGMGFQVNVVKNGDRGAILKALRTFEADAKQAEVALFYFAGHGVQVEGNNYLVPIGIALESENDVRDQAVEAGSVLRRIEGTGTKIGLVILDACRDNPFVRKTRSISRGLNRMDVPTGTIVAYATASGSVADDGDNKNGVYTEQLARYLREPGLDIREVFDRTASEVERLTKGKQKPREDIGLRGKFLLVPAPEVVKVEPPAPSPVDDDTLTWQTASQLHTQEAYQAYLKRYPKGQYKQAAQAALNALKPAAPVDKKAESARLVVQRMEEAWSQARIGNQEKLTAFLQKYPDTRWTDEAKRLIKELDERDRLAQEQHAWSNALASDTIKSYQQYLGNYPDGRFANQAQERVKRLQQASEATVNPSAPPAQPRAVFVLPTL